MSITSLSAPGFHLGHTLASGQVFRWGRDADGWWKGIVFGAAFHLKQEGERLLYRASSDRIGACAGTMGVSPFLRWYLRLDEPPRVRVPKGDRRLREALRALAGFRFVRQEPFECILSYVLSVQAHMGLTKRRIAFLSQTFGTPVDFEGERYWAFPTPDQLAPLTGEYLRAHRFGYRSEKVATSARIVAGRPRPRDLAAWREVGDLLHATPGSGVGLKVAKCLDLFALDRLGAFAVDTWVRKMAEDWYGVTGSDARICAWGEARYGPQAGYAGEHLFAWYREQHATALTDRVIAFCASGEPSPEMPFERM
jgi:N-glycosylase/DNA lyase